jgi:hypothetical protein
MSILSLMPCNYHVALFRPHKRTSLGTSSRNDILARSERLPKVGEEVGALLNVPLAKQGCNSPSCLLAVVEGDTAVLLLAAENHVISIVVKLTETCGARRGTR